MVENRDWGLGIEDWGQVIVSTLSPVPNPQSPIT